MTDQPIQRADPVRAIIRSLPDDLWDASFWTCDETWVTGTVDVADRYRIVREILRQIDGG